MNEKLKILSVEYLWRDLSRSSYRRHKSTIFLTIDNLPTTPFGSIRPIVSWECLIKLREVLALSEIFDFRDDSEFVSLIAWPRGGSPVEHVERVFRWRGRSSPAIDSDYWAHPTGGGSLHVTAVSTKCWLLRFLGYEFTRWGFTRQPCVLLRTRESWYFCGNQGCLDRGVPVGLGVCWRCRTTTYQFTYLCRVFDFV